MIPYGKVVKSIFEEIGARSDFSFETMEVDQDHMHCLVKSEPGISPLAIVRRLKQASTFRLWRTYEKDLQRHFWKERTFWSDGYFCCTIGNASEEAIRHYMYVMWNLENSHITCIMWTTSAFLLKSFQRMARVFHIIANQG